MNLNDFVVFPNKPRSVKLNVRSLRELRLETVQLDQENKDMENRLQQLRETMSQEKEEREKCGVLRWRSAQPGALARSKEKAARKLSPSKMKIRVLKDETLSEAQKLTDRAPCPPPGVAGSSRRPQLRGKPCGQCEARSAGLMCAECGEDYCVGCFAKFHQKGALKHHRMIPLQAELHTSISSLDVLGRFLSQVGEQRGRSGMSPRHSGAGPDAKDTPRHAQTTPTHHTQAMPTHHTQNTPDHHAQNTQAVFLNEKEMEDDDGEGSLLRGDFDEEESSRSFQRALAEWREKEQTTATPDESDRHRYNITVPSVRPEVEAMGTQAEGRSHQPICIEFREQGLSYMERLLLKRHRRSQLQSCRLMSAPSCLQAPLLHSVPQPSEESQQLTAEELDLRGYCASLFAVAAPAGGAGSGEARVAGLSITEIEEDAGDTLVNGTSGVRQRDDKKKRSVQGGENLSSPSRSQGAKEVLYPEESPLSSLSSPAVPTEVKAELVGQPAPSEQLSSLVPSQKLQALESQSPSAGLSSSARLNAHSSRVRQVQQPSLSDLPQAHTSRRSSASTPSSRQAESSHSSPAVLSQSSGGRPGHRDTQDFCSSHSPPPHCLQHTPQCTATAPAKHHGMCSSQGLLPPRTAVPRSPSHSLTPSPGAAPSPSQPHYHSLGPGSRTSPVPADPPLSSCSLECEDSLDSPGSWASHIHPSANSARSTNLHGMPFPLLLPPRSELSPLMSLSDSDRSSDCANWIPTDEDSSDEEMKRYAGRQEWEEQEEGEGEEEEESISPSLQCSPSPGGDDPLRSQHPLHGRQATPPSGLFTQPSLALSSLAQRDTNVSGQYQGLEGFLTLGLDSGRLQSSPAPPPTPPQRPGHLGAFVGGQGRWRPASSLLLHAEEELVTTVINSQPISRTLLAASPNHNAVSLSRQYLSAGVSAPGLSDGSTSDSARSCPAGTGRQPHAASRPLSRAALEIMEVQSVQRAALGDSNSEEDEEDYLALAGLEEEFKKMSSNPSD